MKLKSWIFEGIRWIAALAMVACLILIFGGDPVSNAEFADVSAAVLPEVDTANMQEAESQMVKRLYGLDPVQFEGCILYYPLTNMDAEELLLIKLKDVSQQEAIRSAVEARLQTQKNTFDGYGVDQMDLLTNYCVVDVRENYALFVVSKTSEAAQSAFRDAL